MDPSHFLEEVDEEFICSICTEVLLNPVSCSQGHVFCYSCIAEWCKTNRTCPQDRKDLKRGVKGMTKSRVVATLIGKLAVRCTHGGQNGKGGTAAKSSAKKAAKGKRKRNSGKQNKEEDICPWTGKLNTRGQHLQHECAFEQAACSFAGCSSSVQRRLLPEHQDGCKKRPWQCDHCNKKLQFSDRSAHYKVCQKMEVSCKRRNCSAKFPRRLAQAHKDKDCRFEPVECPFELHGCKVKLTRGEFGEHQAAAATEHSALLAERVAAMQDNFEKRLSAMERKVKEQANSITTSFSEIVTFNEGSRVDTSNFYVGDQKMSIIFARSLGKSLCAWLSFVRSDTVTLRLKIVGMESKGKTKTLTFGKTLYDKLHPHLVLQETIDGKW